MESVQGVSTAQQNHQLRRPGREAILTRMSGSSSMSDPFTLLIAAGRGILSAAGG